MFVNNLLSHTESRFFLWTSSGELQFPNPQGRKKSKQFNFKTIELLVLSLTVYLDYSLNLYSKTKIYCIYMRLKLLRLHSFIIQRFHTAASHGRSDPPSLLSLQRTWSRSQRTSTPPEKQYKVKGISAKNCWNPCMCWHEMWENKQYSPQGVLTSSFQVGFLLLRVSHWLKLPVENHPIVSVLTMTAIRMMRMRTGTPTPTPIRAPTGPEGDTHFTGAFLRNHTT